jgi:hypothetical protein
MKLHFSEQLFAELFAFFNHLIIMAWFAASAWGALVILLYIGLFLLALLTFPVPDSLENVVNAARMTFFHSFLGFDVCRPFSNKLRVRFIDLVLVICLILSYMEVGIMRKVK